MALNNIETINIFGIRVAKLNYEKFLDIIKESILKNQKLTIGYANADTLNKICNSENLNTIFNTFDLIHPDGIGVYWASKFLYGKDGLETRTTGSDFYHFLIEECIKNKWRVFFFGHRYKILNKINKLHPALNITGIQEGYQYLSSNVVKCINDSDSDIIIVGLSSPIQEKWIIENKQNLNFKIILLVGEGIRVFAGKKIRGPVIFRKIGLEWLVRYISNPVANFRKYIVGVPLFIIRVLKEKLKSY